MPNKAKRSVRGPASRKAPASTIRRATLADLQDIAALEVACFQDYRRASERSLKSSLASSAKPTTRTGRRQSVWVVNRRDGPGLAALLVLWHFPRRLRIYDIATHPEARGQGLGRLLMTHAEVQARKAGCTYVTLEAEEADQRLVAWYAEQGFLTVARLQDFYHGGCHALRMVRKLA